MTNRYAVTETMVYQECPGGRWALYTPEPGLIRAVRTWKRYKEGFITEYGPYQSIYSGRPHAYEFRFDRTMKKQVEKAAAKYMKKAQIPRVKAA